MPKIRSQFVCQECGAEFLKSFGRCPSCQAWGTLVEQVLPVSSNPPRAGGLSKLNLHVDRDRVGLPTSALQFHDIEDHPQSRLSSGYGELDRVLGGGLVPGSLVLVGGDPGIGKSTLLLQVANQLSGEHSILYVCAEESAQQVKLRSQRLGITGSNTLAAAADSELYLLPEIDLDTIILELTTLRPAVAVIDSIQAIYWSTLTSAPGSVAQVRECTATLMRVAKQLNITLLIVGHVTKEGTIAGPKVLEHLVDTVLYFEGDRFASHRLLRTIKNRFGATHEIGVFEMVDQGVREVLNPSELFLGNRDESTAGTATIVACEGTRPIVVELQALVSPTSYSSPRRSATGIEYNRFLQILAVLEKRLGIPLSKLDAYVASSAGLSVEEPAADLGIAIAVAASFRDRCVDPGTLVIGEVGLGGQIRSVSQMEIRLKEAAKLGFRRAIVPKGQDYPAIDLEIVSVTRLLEAITTVLS
jgi:DNA repair protein RadA/Sms